MVTSEETSYWADDMRKLSAEEDAEIAWLVADMERLNPAEETLWVPVGADEIELSVISIRRIAQRFDWFRQLKRGGEQREAMQVLRSLNEEMSDLGLSHWEMKEVTNWWMMRRLTK